MSIEAAIFTNGRSSFPRMLESVNRQTSPFVHHTISGMDIVDAMNSALDKCSSEYFVKIDDDFMLHPLAFAFIEECIEKHAREDVAFYWWHLWDFAERKSIQSLKVYNTKLAKKVGFRSDERGRIDLCFIHDTKEKGLKSLSYTDVLAVHAQCPVEDEREYQKMWAKLSSSGFYVSDYASKKRRKSTLDEQFDESPQLIEVVNRRCRTEFSKFMNEVLDV